MTHPCRLASWALVRKHPAGASSPKASIGSRQEPQKPHGVVHPTDTSNPRKFRMVSQEGMCHGSTPGRAEEAAFPPQRVLELCWCWRDEASCPLPCPGFPSCWCSLDTAQVRTPELADLGPISFPALPRVPTCFCVPRFWLTANAETAAISVLAPWNHNPTGLHLERRV